MHEEDLGPSKGGEMYKYTRKKTVFPEMGQPKSRILEMSQLKLGIPETIWLISDILEMSQLISGIPEMSQLKPGILGWVEE